MTENAAKLAGAAAGLPPAGLIAVAWVGFSIAAMLVGLRLYARIAETRKLHSDDYWMIAALTFLLANAILQTLQTDSLYYLVYSSAGRVPAGQALLDHGNMYVRYEFTIIGIFWTVCWCVKASFLALYYRLFDGLPNYRKMWWCVVVFAALAYAGCWIASAWVWFDPLQAPWEGTLTSLQTCHPPSVYFKFGSCTKPEDNRGSVISISYSTAVDVITDIMIMLMPIRLLPNLQIDKRQKIGLASIFGIGVIIIAAAIVRCTQVLARARSDPVGLAVWGLVESSISVMVGALPALKAMLARTVHRTIHWTRGSSGGSLRRGTFPTHDESTASKSRLGVKSIPLQDRDRSESQEHITRKPLEEA